MLETVRHYIMWYNNTISENVGYLSNDLIIISSIYI